MNDSATIHIKHNGRKKKSSRQNMVIALFLVPACLIFLVYIMVPLLQTFYYSLLKWDGGINKTFIGVQNYKTLVMDGIFGRAFCHNLVLVLASVFVQVPLGLGLSLLLFSKMHGKKLYQTLAFLPYLMSTVGIGLLWTLMYDPINGSINNFIEMLGMKKIMWLSDPKTAMLSVLVVIVWQCAPFYMILFKAALVGIPEDLYEASTLDGANAWSQFKNITIPMLWPTIIASATLALVGSLKSFDLIYIMTSGGPNNQTELMGTYMFKIGFVQNNLGYASAIAFAMFVIALTATGLCQLIENKRGSVQ